MSNDGKKKKIKYLKTGDTENRFFVYNGSGSKVRVLKIVRQIQTNVKQSDDKKKN
jgi:hypothetical protein